jgi:putative protease
MAISGKCYLSLQLSNRSANRGECLQPCRREYNVIIDSEEKYLIKELEQNFELQIDNKRIMSPKDLCTILFLDKLLIAGARVLKIEGRGRSPEYVKRVVEIYNAAINKILANEFSEVTKQELLEKLKEVYNRGFWDGYYLGQRIGE